MGPSDYDSQFAEAMALKLKLNRQQRSETSVKSAASSEPSAPTGVPMRDSIMKSVMAKHPLLTKEELSKQMEEMGF